MTNESHVVVMEYEAWFTPSHSLPAISHFYEPALTSANISQGYDSRDSAVVAQHIQWLEELGVDAIIAEETNGAPCDPDFGTQSLCASFLKRPVTDPTLAAYGKSIASINQSTFQLYPAFARNGTAIKIIPLLDGQDSQMFEPLAADGTTAFDRQVGAYLQRMTDYPQLNVIYQGKPLLLVYLAPIDPNDPIFSQARHAITKWQSQLTVRLMSGEIDSLKNIWANPNAGLHPVNTAYQLWSWIDRLNPGAGLYPSYTTTGPRAESFTVSNATPGTTVVDDDGAWNASDAGLYNNGATFSQFMTYARQVNPVFLIVNQFNEFAAPDQGADEQHSNDIEPTAQWGRHKFDTVKQGLLAYRKWFQAQVMVPGFFKLATQGTIYNSNGLGHYCAFPSWGVFSAAGGAVDLSNVLVVDSILPGMTQDGSCATSNPGPEPTPAPTPNPTPAPPEDLATVPVYRMYKAGDYLLTQSKQEGLSAGYGLEYNFNFYQNGGANRTAVYRCLGANHFVSKDIGCEGFQNEGLLGYLDASSNGNDQPVYRLWNSQTGFHMVTYTPSEGAGVGFIEESQLGYGLP